MFDTVEVEMDELLVIYKGLKENRSVCSLFLSRLNVKWRAILYWKNRFVIGKIISMRIAGTTLEQFRLDYFKLE